MTKPLLDRALYDHPEHFDDEIRAYRTSSRYVPTALESLLYELSGHRCTICGAPWLEVHHIEELGNGGHTTYDNLIVLCPNCHTRVHSEGIPSKDELKHYKLKQEIAYELPVLSRLSPEERALVFEIAGLSPDRQFAFSRRYHANVSAPNQDEAIEKYRTDVGHLHLQEAGILAVDLEHVVTLEDNRVSVALRLRVTGKGVKWLRYLSAAGRVPTP
jgi:hypothetical protein